MNKKSGYWTNSIFYDTKCEKEVFMQRLLVLVPVLVFAMYGIPTHAGEVFIGDWNITGETEWGYTGDGERQFSQYLFGDKNPAEGKPGVNLTLRLFRVNRILRQIEFAAGPTFKVGEKTTLKVWGGGTTAGAIMLGGSIFTSVGGRDILYILDPKISRTKEPDGIYQKIFVPIDKDGIFQFRVESLQLDLEPAFVRMGVEWQFRLPRSTHIFVHPYFDAVNDTIGIHTGFRF